MVDDERPIRKKNKGERRNAERKDCGFDAGEIQAMAQSEARTMAGKALETSETPLWQYYL